ncbi:hypothetical protein HPB49_014970 [Dermacentor silvarum]|uniref:Uncharacterized protein n=1 Tax=Dermacentor silvarum TaxID=543639 RepID=A0ACB8D6G6_DERSI|nr:hypothetical protein HPB49_014970 [Dermacentor silvarum]
MLRNLATSEQRRLLDCYNNIWWSGQVQEAWRTAIVAPILKNNKPANELSSYRPVSLTSAACKVMEAIALARLEWVARACGFLADQQTGFRRRRCTADSIADVVSTLEDARASGDLAMLLLIDVKGAFDGLPHAVVQQALDLLGIGGNLRRFLSSFLNDRTLRVRVGHARSAPPTQILLLCYMFTVFSIFYVSWSYATAYDVCATLPALCGTVLLLSALPCGKDQHWWGSGRRILDWDTVRSHVSWTLLLVCGSTSMISQMAERHNLVKAVFDNVDAAFWKERSPVTIQLLMAFTAAGFAELINSMPLCNLIMPIVFEIVRTLPVGPFIDITKTGITRVLFFE